MNAVTIVKKKSDPRAIPATEMELLVPYMSDVHQGNTHIRLSEDTWIEIFKDDGFVHVSHEEEREESDLRFLRIEPFTITFG